MRNPASNIIRPVPREAPDDQDAIGRLLAQAFAPSTYETRLVRRLNTRGRELCQWVTENSDRRIVAYICYSRAYGADGKSPIGWHLAPLAVHPRWQHRGLGADLARSTLAAPELGGEAVFVLGDPGYYRRFGFELIQAPRCPFDLAGGHFSALRRRPTGGGDDFTIGYEPEFTETE